MKTDPSSAPFFSIQEILPPSFNLKLHYIFETPKLDPFSGADVSSLHLHT
jgi:hypothetical protein